MALQEEFVARVLATRPRLAVFDCDGTLWANNSGEDFFYWSIAQGMVSAGDGEKAKARYQDYRDGKVAEGEMCGEMTTMYAGIPVARLQAAAAEFFATRVKPNYFAEMLRLTQALASAGCELWAVSSTNEWVIAEGVKEFGIPEQNILAAASECAGGIAGSRLLRMPSGEGKAEALREVVRRTPDTVFGNSIHDAAMMRMAKTAYAINPNPDLEKLARGQGWTIYFPAAMRG